MVIIILPKYLQIYRNSGLKFGQFDHSSQIMTFITAQTKGVYRNYVEIKKNQFVLKYNEITSAEELL